MSSIRSPHLTFVPTEVADTSATNPPASPTPSDSSGASDVTVTPGRSRRNSTAEVQLRSQWAASKYVGKVPIKKLSLNETKNALSKFQENLRRLEPDLDAVRIDFHTAAMQDVNDEKKGWYLRLIQTQDVLDLLADGEHLNRRDTSVFGCMDEDKPVGMMALRQIETEQPDDPREPPIIEVLVTIPDSKGAGKSLVERAVNISASWGTGGRLRLEPKNDEAKKAFQAMGFVDSDSYMELDPASSSKWWRKDEKWQIRRHENDRK